MKVTIPVKRKHIDGCKMATVTNCVMALAMTDALPLAAEVKVGVRTAHLYGMDGRMDTIILPMEVSDFIGKVVHIPSSSRHKIAECNFEVEIPDKFCAKEPVRSVQPKQEEEPVPA
jgi:hypothetical protein